MASSSRQIRPRPASVSKGGRTLRPNSNTDGKWCYPWITRNGEELQVFTPKPLQRADLATNKFLNFATIIGPARQGKSFLMNCIIGENVFGTADTIGVCTKGIQVASVVHDVKNRGGAFFVDTEGQGDEDVDSDATLLTPILLLSKVILFNWKGGLQKNQILNELAILVEVGNCVSCNSFESGTSKFGHLHIVLRDFHFEGTAKEAVAMIFDEENKRGEKVKERNKVREKLLSSFESINISIFPAPCEDIHNLDSNTTSKEFKKSVKELKDTILDQMSQPRSFGTVVVNCQNVDVLIKKFVEELQEGDIVHVKSVVSQLQRVVVDEAKRCFEESLVEAYKKIDVPVRYRFKELLTQERDALLDAFRQSTRKVDLEAVYRDKVYEDLKHFADREFDGKRKENLLAIQSRKAEQNKILVTAVEEFKSAIESELRNSEESKQMQQRFLECKSKMVSDFLKKTGTLNWIPDMVEKEFEKLNAWVSVRFDETVKAKQKEEKYKKRSEQQLRLSKAVDNFRSGVESALQKSKEWSTSSLNQKFRQEKEKLIGIFRNNTDGMDQISHRREAEIEKLENWAAKKFEEEVQAASEAKRLREREQKLSFTGPQPSVYNQYSGPSFSAPPWCLDASLSSPFNHASPPSFQPASPFDFATPPATPFGFATPPASPFGFGTPPASPFSSVKPSLSQNIPAAPRPGLKFYKGGQFLPGGGRAPKGGCHRYPSSASKPSRSKAPK